MSTCSLRRWLAVGALGFPSLLTASPAHAQAQDQATARALFNEARDLMKSGHYDEACPKLEAASKLYVGSGVLLNLGDCYEHVGRTASAWTEFGEAATAAQQAGRAEDLAEAQRRQAALEPKLSRLAIRVAHEVPGLVVKRDHTELDRGAWAVAVPVDPGKHVIGAEAPGHAPWSAVAAVEDLGKTVTVDVPDLPAASSDAQPAGPAAVPVAPPAQDTAATTPPSYWTGRRVAGVVIAGAGLVAFGVGVALGPVAKSQYDEAQKETGPQQKNDSASAVSTGNVGTAVGVVGAAVAVGGLVLWLTAPSAPVQVGATGSAVVLRGTF
jgi:hypothetical protein